MVFGSDEEDEESEADPDDCFEKPWEHDQFNVMGGQNHFRLKARVTQSLWISLRSLRIPFLPLPILSSESSLMDQPTLLSGLLLR